MENKGDVLSVQHLYYRCKARDEVDGPGTYISLAAEIVRDAGQCLDSTWPYSPREIPGNEGQGPPPPSAAQEAFDYRIALPFKLEGGSVIEIQRVLAGFEIDGAMLPGRPVVFGIPVFNSMFGGATSRTGKVLMPLPGETPRGGHAMAYFGYRVSSGVPGGGYTLFQNSWGEGWARENGAGAGRGRLPFAYIEKYGHSDAYAFFTAEEADLLAGRGLVRAAGSSSSRARSAASSSLRLGRRGGDARPVDISTESLNRHLLAIGNSGSGKTVFCKLVCEQALAQGIPVVALDPQGDIASMASLISRVDAAKLGLDTERWDCLADGVEPVIFTPESSAGIPICANPFASSEGASAWATNPIQFAQGVDALAEALVGRLEALKRTPAKRDFYEAALRPLIEHGLKHGGLDQLDDLAALLAQPPGDLDAEIMKVLPSRKDLDNLRRAVNVLLGSAKRYLFDYGVPLDIDLLIGRAHNPKGKTRLSVVYLNSLSGMADKEYFVSLLAANLYQWMLQHPPRRSGVPQLILLIDEIGLFIPNPSARKKPVCKEPLLKLFQQARKYGVAIVGATQTPANCDYTALGQANNVCLGTLKTVQEFQKVKALLASVPENRPDEAVTRLRPGEFYLSAPDSHAQTVHLQGELTMLGMPRQAARVSADIGAITKDAYRTLREDDLGDLVSGEVRARFEQWCRMPGPTVTAGMEQDDSRGSSAQHDAGEAEHGKGAPVREGPEARRHDESQEITETEPEAAFDDRLVDILSDSQTHRALTKAELVGRVSRLDGDAAGQAGPSARRVSQSLSRLVDGKVVLRDRDGQRTVHFLPEHGFLPEAGVYEKVLYPVALGVDNRGAAARIAGGRGLALRKPAKPAMTDPVLISLPLWKVRIRFKKGVWPLKKEIPSCLYLDALTRWPLALRDREIRFEEHLRGDLAGAYIDWFEAVDFRPTSPALAARLPHNYRKIVRRAALQRHIESYVGRHQRALEVEDFQVEGLDLVFLPFWLSTPVSRRTNRAAVCVDALFGFGFRPPRAPDLRSLRG